MRRAPARRPGWGESTSKSSALASTAGSESWGPVACYSIVSWLFLRRRASRVCMTGYFVQQAADCFSPGMDRRRADELS
jgi:hypothetical protein